MSNEQPTEAPAAALRAALLDEVRQHLEDARLRLHEEISGYPRPITACDAQFNYLLEKRTRLGSELGMLEELTSKLRHGDVDVSVIEAYVAASDHMDSALAEKLIAAFR